MSRNVCEMIEEKIAELLQVRALLVEVEEALRPLEKTANAVLGVPQPVPRGKASASRVDRARAEAGYASPFRGRIPSGPVVVRPAAPVTEMPAREAPHVTTPGSLDDLVRELSERVDVVTRPELPSLADTH